VWVAPLRADEGAVLLIDDCEEVCMGFNWPEEFKAWLADGCPLDPPSAAWADSPAALGRPSARSGSLIGNA